MRVRTTRLLGVLAIGGVMLSSTACLPGLDGVTGGGEKTAACNAMTQEISSVSTRATQNLSNPTAMAQIYSDAATKVRAEGQKAGGDVQEAAGQVADDLEELAQLLRDLDSGNIRVPDTSKLTTSGARLQQACAS
ncbi:hypothetical protein SAMN04489712_1504 [Thermomonospora echinospora]|uniref:Small secreted protein n=1 Tax=Thermomonospora echinospora TaxID=1992 RepID=A0A1H6E9Z8_9ACTN|nr:hypothetical protein [Thermomonospora echinospora]SEG94678.1 hypothetical protein SAMN04489712_1504 [Thermomonospora echinospora]